MVAPNIVEQVLRLPRYARAAIETPAIAFQEALVRSCRPQIKVPDKYMRRLNRRGDQHPER